MSKYSVVIFVVSLMLWSIGLLTIQSTMPRLMAYHLLYGLIGIVSALAISRLNPVDYTGSRWLWYLLSVMGLLMTEFFGVLSRGSTRWIMLFGFQFQTSEFVKIAMCLFVAQTISTKPLTALIDVLRFIVIILVPTLIVFIEPDLGTSLVIGFITLTAIISSGFSFKKLGLMFLLALLTLPIGLSLLQPYQKNRIETFLNPNHDPLGAGYNVRQAAIAVGSGMVHGRGLGQGTQSHLKFLPERHTDFIFASFVEESGFIGGILVLSLYLVFGMTAFKIAKYARTQTETYLCLLIGTIIIVQASINIGMNVGIIPVTGITLPFISYGGSSLASTWILVGILLGCSSRVKQSYLELRVS